MTIQPVYIAPNGPPIINGANFGVVNESVMTFKPFSGGESGGTFEGPDAVIQAKAIELAIYGYQVDYKRSKSPISTVSFRSAWTAGGGGGSATNPNLDYVDSWELIGNTVQKELLESDHPSLSYLGSSNFQILKNLITGSGPDKFTGNATTFNNGPTSPDYLAACYLWALFQSGVKTVPVKQPILQLTRTTNPLYAAPFNTTNIDTVLTTASMLTDSGVPTSFAIPLLSLAENLAAKAGDMVTRAAKSGLILQFGWYKDLVSSNKHGTRRVQFCLRYEFGLFDVVLYGNPT
jgi:hypothetical protein